MKALIEYGLAAVIVLATAMPAMARSWDVCIDPAADLNATTENASGLPLFFSAAANIYPRGTFVKSTNSSPLTSCTTSATAVGTFFAKGALVANLPKAGTSDVFYVDWHFRIGTRAFDTSGLVESGNPGDTYPQTITGGNGGLAPAIGKATVTILSNAGDSTGATVDAFRIRLP
jgi:hypothetical protein